MRLTRAFVALLTAATLGLAGCGDDDEDPTGPQISAFAGAWTANSIRYTSKTDQNRTLDIVPVGGGLSMNITSTGTFTGTLKLPTAQGVVPIPIKGDVQLQGSSQARVDFDWSGTQFTDANAPIGDFTATYNLQGNLLTFTRNDATFQFPTQPQPEAAVVVISMTRS